MADITLDTIRTARAVQAMQQEKEAFEQARDQAKSINRLKVAIGWMSVVMIPVIALISAYIIFNYKSFPMQTVTVATGALFADVLGLIISVWKGLLNPNTFQKLEPFTRYEDAVLHSRDGKQYVSNSNVREVGNSSKNRSRTLASETQSKEE